MPAGNKSEWGSGLSLFPRPVKIEGEYVVIRPYEPQKDSRFVDALSRIADYRALKSLVDDR
jgi:hypothetical protein